MKIWTIVAGSALVAAAGILPVAAHATPVSEAFDSSNLLGVTGNILTPTAAVVPSGCLDLGSHYMHGQDFNVDRQRAFGLPDVITVHGNLGLFNHLELGGAYRIVLDSPVPDHAYMNAKFRATSLKSPLQLAAGVMDATDNIDRTVYAVGTLHAGNITSSPFLRHLEVGGGWRFSEGNRFGNEPVDAPFVNGKIGLGNVAALMAEWQPEQDLDENAFVPATGSVNAGLRIRVPNKLPIPKASSVVLDIDGIGLDDHPTWAVGLTMRLCFGQHHKKNTEEGGEEKGEEKGEPKSDQKVEASPLFPSKSLGLSAHLASAK